MGRDGLSMIELAEAFAGLGTASKVLERAIAMRRRMRCRVKTLVLLVINRVLGFIFQSLHQSTNTV